MRCLAHVFGRRKLPRDPGILRTTSFYCDPGRSRMNLDISGIYSGLLSYPYKSDSDSTLRFPSRGHSGLAVSFESLLFPALNE